MTRVTYSPKAINTIWNEEWERVRSAVLDTLALTELIEVRAEALADKCGREAADARIATLPRARRKT